MGVPVRRVSCCRSRRAAPGPEKRETWSSSNRTTNSRGRGLANGERAAWNPRANAAEALGSRARRAAEKRRVAVSHHAGKRAPRVTGRKRHRGGGGDHSSMEGISDRGSLIAVTGGGGEAVFGPSEGGRASVGWRSRTRRRRQGCQGYGRSVHVGEENAPACRNRAVRRSGQGAVKHQALRTRAGASSLRVGSRRSTGARCQCDGKQSLVGRIARRSSRGAARQSEAGGASWKEAASR